MIIKNVAAVAVLALTLASTANIRGAQEAGESGRGDTARHLFTIRHGFSAEEEDAVKAGARKCVWENWRRKRPAHCALIWKNIEGELTTQNFYVDRGKGGRPHVFFEVEYICCWHYALEGKAPETELKGAATYKIVERMDIKSRRVVSETEDRQPHSYVLRFREDESVNHDAATLRYL